MARPLRIEQAGGWYHITARGNERRSLYRSDPDREHFCQLLAEVTRSFAVILHAYVLMDNHYHLLLELREPNLSRAVQWLNVSYSIWFNRRHRRSGHLFQGRFKSVIVSPQEWGLELSRYLHLNPVRVGKLGLGKAAREQQRQGVSRAPKVEQVRERIERLRSYRWSSYRAYIGAEQAPSWLECQCVLGLGGGRKNERPRRYRDYAESAVREGLSKSPWEELQEQSVLGGAGFLEEIRAGVRGDEQEQRGARRLAARRPELEAVIRSVERLRGEKWESFRDRRGDPGRELVLYLGRSVCGLKLVELARSVGAKGYGSVAMAIRRYAARLKHDGLEQERVRKAGQMLNVKI
jgi:putative transposase